MKCFVDTGAFAALHNEQDDHHEEAKILWAFLRNQNAELFTTRDVIVETLILVRGRTGHHQAVVCGEDLWNNPVLEILRPEPHHDRAAWDLFKRRPAVELSFVDCLSFILMKELRLRHAFTFDDDFARAGFEVLHS